MGNPIAFLKCKLGTSRISIQRLISAAAFLGLRVGSAQAGVIINIEQVGSDVVATGSGTIDLIGFTFSTTYGFNPSVDPEADSIHLGSAASNMPYYTGATGP